jgi:phosphoglycerate dehydrogenase-like enzyme
MPPIPRTPIKLAILDDYQSLALPHFSSLGNVFEITVFKDTLPPYCHASTTPATQQAIIDRLKPFTVISSMRERTAFPAALLEKLPNLKLLLNAGMRNASIDLNAARRLGIRVTGTTGKGAKKRGPDSTTQHAVALILGLARRLAADDLEVKKGGWQTGVATGLSGRVFGTVGLGRLGSNVAKIMNQSFGMRVIAWSSSLTQEAADQKAKEAGLEVTDEDGEKTFKFVSKEELFKQADVLSIHYVLSERSRGIVDAPDLALMKPSALFINTSRGPLVVESALLNVLEQGKIRGAALDVFDLEPLPKDSKWRSEGWGKEAAVSAGPEEGPGGGELKRAEGGKLKSQVLLSPHMGYVEEESMKAWFEEQVGLVEKWYRGEDLGGAVMA